MTQESNDPNSIKKNNFIAILFYKMCARVCVGVFPANTKFAS